MMAQTLACFEGTPCENGFHGTSHGDCIDVALRGATALTGPPIAMASRGAPVATSLMLLPMA